MDVRSNKLEPEIYLHKCYVDARDYAIEKGYPIVLETKNQDLGIESILQTYGLTVFDIASNLFVSALIDGMHHSQHSKGVNASNIMMQRKIQKDIADKNEYIDKIVMPRNELVYTPTRLLGLWHVENPYLKSVGLDQQQGAAYVNTWLVTPQSLEAGSSVGFNPHVAFLCFSEDAADQVIRNIKILSNYFSVNFLADLPEIKIPNMRSLADDKVYQIQNTLLDGKKIEILQYILQNSNVQNDIVKIMGISSPAIINSDNNQLLTALKKFMIIERSNDFKDILLFHTGNEYFDIHFKLHNRREEHAVNCLAIMEGFTAFRNITHLDNINNQIFHGELNHDMVVQLKKYFRDITNNIYAYCAREDISTSQVISVIHGFIQDFKSININKIYKELPKKDLFVDYKKIVSAINYHIGLNDIELYVNKKLDNLNSVEKYSIIPNK